MIICPKCNEPATPFNASPEMRESLFFWCKGCDTPVIPLIAYIETDLNRQLAHDAHRGTSFSPDKRAEEEIDSYMAEMEAVSARFAKFATPENEAPLRAALEQYRLGYLRRLNARLAAQSRIISTMIAGPSNFPARQMQKRNATEHKRTIELLEWREKALARLNRDYNPVAIARRPIRSDEADAIEQLQAKIDAAERLQSTMKMANRIVRKKKLTDGEKVVELVKFEGIDGGVARQLIEPEFLGFPGFKLTNNNANIKRMKGRVIQLQAEAARPEVKDRKGAIDGTLVTVVENGDEGRLQLIFDGKPPDGIIQTLKGHGFNWSRKNQAWQRLLNDKTRGVVEWLLE